MITIFTIPKAFHGEFELIQRNAIISWTQLEPKPHVVLLGDDDGVADLTQELELDHVPSVRRNEVGTPMVNDILHQGQKASQHRLCAYVNADIILMNDFMAAAQRVPFRRFLMIGQRWDWRCMSPLDFSDSGWASKLRSLVAKEGTLFTPMGLDYFLFPSGFWTNDLQPFAIGRFAWDNYLVLEARRMHAHVVNATSAVMAIHQLHGYSHVPHGTGDDIQGPEAKKNLALLPENSYFDVRDATWVLTPTRIKPVVDRTGLRRRWESYRVLQPLPWRVGRKVVKAVNGRQLWSLARRLFSRSQ